MKREAILRRIVGDHPRVLLARHFDRDGSALFGVVRENGLKGIVAKRKAAYGVDWFKIRNPTYSQYEGRREPRRAMPLYVLRFSWPPVPASPSCGRHPLALRV